MLALSSEWYDGITSDMRVSEKPYQRGTRMARERSSLVSFGERSVLVTNRNHRMEPAARINGQNWRVPRLLSLYNKTTINF